MAKKSKALAAEPLEPLELFALKIAAKQCADVRARLDVGEHPFDATFAIAGTISVAGDQTSVARESLPAKLLLGLVFDFLGPLTTEKVIAGVREACAPYVAGGADPEPSDKSKNFGDDLAAACSRQVEKVKAGNVTGVLDVRVVRRA